MYQHDISVVIVLVFRVNVEAILKVFSEVINVANSEAEAFISVADGWARISGFGGD